MKTRKNLMVLVLLSLFLSVGVADSDVKSSQTEVIDDLGLDLEPELEENLTEAQIKVLNDKEIAYAHELEKKQKRGEKLTEDEKSTIEIVKQYEEGERLARDTALTKEDTAKTKKELDDLRLAAAAS